MLDAYALWHKEVRMKRSFSTRVYFQCTKLGCEFSCHIHQGGEDIFRVAERSRHTCWPFIKAFVKGECVTQKAREMLGEREESLSTGAPGFPLPDHWVEVKYHAAMEVVEKAGSLHGEEEWSFDKLPGPSKRRVNKILEP